MKGNALKLQSSTVVTVLAVALLAILAFRHLSTTPQPPVASAANCSQQAIRAVADAMERAILSGRCATQASTERR